MICASCGEANREGARFCIECGAAFVVACGGCGAELPPKAKFCDDCGAPVGSANSAQAPPAMATRRTVTVLFADLTGSTTIGERMDPEALRALMGPFYASMRRAVETLGGRIVKFQGDGVMAAFGLDEVHEDDATRALRAALAMQQAVADLPVTHDVMLSLKVGVNTGEVVVSEGDEDLVGDSVNVAARLEGAAAPGEVIVGEETWRLTRGAASYDPIAPLSLKGKTEPVPAYRLVAMADDTAEAGSVPFVGRDAELARLTESFEDVVANRTAGLVTIVGSPGLGKTRLTQEFARQLEGRALVVETRCDAASTYAFAPIADAFRATGVIDEAAEPDAVLAAVAELIPEDEEDRDRIARLIASILGAAPPGSTEETFWAIRRMLEIAATTQPIVQIVDDMHWAEPVLLDLIQHLVEWVNDVPLLIVVTGRPELREIRSSLCEQAIALEGLDEGATGLLARELLGGDPLPAELLARLPSSTEGNPLFVRELVRMLVDDGVLVRSDDGWRVTIDVDAIDVPPTIHSLLSARVDRLRPEERTVVELASVIGREFYRGALLELAAPALVGEIDVHLESLRRKELVEPVGTYWIDEPVYRFHHVLIRDAAYRRLLKESRAELHGRVARWLERKTGGLVGEHDELIGYHLEQAHESRRQLGPLDSYAREIGRRAAALLGSAAERALDRDDLPSAASLSGRALRVLDDESDRSQLLIVRCEALLGMGDVTNGAPAVEELERVASGEARLEGWATCFRGQLVTLSDPQRLHEMEQRVAVAASELAALGDTAGAAKAHTVHAATLARLGRYADCERALDDALTAAREVDDRGRITAVLEALPQAQLWGPNVVSRAGGRCLDVVRLVRITTQSPAVEATSIRCQAVLEALRGRADAARGMLRKPRRVQQELGLRHGLLETELSHGIIELVAGDAAAAEDHLKLAHEGFAAMGAEVFAAQAAALRARACLAMGDEDVADEFAAESERLGGDDLKTAIAWRAVRAQILARQGKQDEARRLAESAVELATPTDALIDHGDALMALAAVHRAAGDVGAARSTEERAVALYERKGATALSAEKYPVAREPIASAPPRPSLTNLASQSYMRWDAAFVARDWDAMRSLLRDDVAGEDRRVAGGGSKAGAEAVMRDVPVIASLGVDRTETTVAMVRGDRLALLRNRWSNTSDPGGFRSDFLLIVGVDESGRIARMTLFDLDDMATATAELDARAAEIETPELENAATQTIALLIDAFRVRDWERFGELIAEDVFAADRRNVLGIEGSGRRDFVEAHKALARIGVDRIENTYLDVRGERLALRWARASNENDPASFESVQLTIDEVDADGRLVRVIFFEEADVDAARAELDARAAVLDAPALENAATRALVRFEEAFVRRDWEAVRALYTDDVVSDDRRTAYRSVQTGLDEFMQMGQALASIGVTRVETTFLAVRGDRLALRRTRFSNADDPDGFDGVVLCVDEVDAGERICGMVVFDESNIAGAIAELDERAQALARASTPEIGRTSVERLATRMDELVATQAWEAADDLLTPDATLEDRRAGLGDRRVGRDAVVEALKAFASLGDLPADQQWVAFRGDRLGLRRVLFSDPADPEAPRYELLNFYEADSSGRLSRLVALDDLDEGIAELDERFIATQPDDVASTLRVALEAFRRSVETDWDAFAHFLGDDFVSVDHRPVYLNELDAPEFIGAQTAWEDIADLKTFLVDVPRVSPQAVLAELTHTGRASDGQDVELANYVLATFRSDRITRMELFADDALGEAIARFEELERGPRRALENAASRALTRSTELIFAGHWDAVTVMFAEELAVDDRRPTLRDAFVGRDRFLESVRFVQSFRATSARWDVVAIRGDGLALIDHVIAAADGDGFDGRRLLVGETNENGEIAALVYFDPDDLHGALIELDARFLSGEGAEHAQSLQPALTAYRHFNGKDWSSLRGVLSDDFVFVAHQPVSIGSIDGADEWITAASTYQSLFVTSHTTVAAVIAFSASAVLGDTRGRATTTDGQEIDVDSLTLAITRGDRVVRVETFAPEQLDEALARFAEVDRDRSFLANEATRVADRFNELALRGDWEAALGLNADDVVFEDRRRRLTDQRTGLEGARDVVWSIAAVGGTLQTQETVAIRGERLLLDRQTYIVDHFDVVVLRLVELNDDGRMKAVIVFDDDDFDVAIAELDDRYYAAEGAPFSAARAFNAAVLRGVRDGEWDDLRTSTDPSFVVIDHRLVSLEPRSAEGFIESTDALVSLLSEVRAYHAWHPRQTPTLSVDNLVFTAVSADGVDIEGNLLGVLVTRSGKAVRLEIYPIDRFDEAIERFDALQAESSRLENACTRIADVHTRAVLAGEWEAVASCLSERNVHDDRRRGTRHLVEGAADVVEYYRSASWEDVVTYEPSVLATRGERMAVIRILFAGRRDAGYEIEMLNVVEIEEDGRIAAWVVFDPDDLDGALAELDQRYTGPTLGRFTQALNRRDWETFTTAFTDDLVVVDHRPTSLGALDRSGWLDAVKVMQDVVPDIHTYFSRVIAVERELRLGEIVQTGHTSAGEVLDFSALSLVQLRGDRVCRIEYFPLEREDEALPRFEELATPDPYDNAAMRALRRSLRTFEERDWESQRVLNSDDVVYEDRRLGLAMKQRGIDALLEHSQSAVTIGADRVETTPIAVRGDRLVLARVTITAANAEATFAGEALEVIELDENDRICTIVVFDGADLSAALMELDERYASGEGAEHADRIREITRIQHDKRWARAVRVTDDLAFVDHRRALFGERHGPEAFREIYGSMFDALRDVRSIIRRIIALTEDRALLDVRVEGMTAEDVAVQLDQIVLTQLREGALQRIEMFDVADEERARERIHAIVRDGVGGNAATVAARTFIDRLTARDWDGIRSSHTADCVVVDNRRGLGHVIRGREAFLDSVRAGSRGELGSPVVEVLATRGDRLGLVRTTWRGRYEVGYLTLYEVDGAGHVRYRAAFEEHDLDRALSELDERLSGGRADPGGDAGPTAPLSNAATRTMRTSHEYVIAGDWSGEAGTLAVDCLYEDFRQGLRNLLTGRDAIIESTQFFAVGQVDSEILAIRGDRLALARTTWSGGFDVPLLSVYEVDAGGSITYIAVFDVDDIVTAARRLTERYTDGEGAAHADLIRTGEDLLEAINDNRWDVFATCFTEDVRVVDRRPAMLGELRGRDGLVSWAESIRDVAASLRTWVVRFHGLAPERSCAEAVQQVTTPDGGSAELRWIAVSAYRGSRIAHLEYFPVDRLDDALARFDELGADAALALENGATRSLANIVGDGGDNEHTLADDVVFEDRRPTFGWQVRGREAFLEHQRMALMGVEENRLDVLAIRGERSALWRGHVTTREGFELEYIGVQEQSDDGRTRYAAIFEPDQIDEAFDELDRRFLGDEGRPYAAIVGVLSEMVRSINSTDWSDFARSVTDDCVVIDHRPASLGQIHGRAQLLEWVGVLHDLSSSTTSRMVRFHRLAPDRALTEVVQDVVTQDGASAELFWLAVSQLRDGQIARIEYFPAERLEDAIARFEELAAPPTPRLENACTRHTERGWATADAGDWDAHMLYVAPDVRFEDRRAGFSWSFEGRDVYLENAQAGTEGIEHRDEVIAIRGDRLALRRIHLRTRQGFEFDFLDLDELDRDGLHCRQILFDPDDLDAAFDELDARWLALGGRSVERNGLIVELYAAIRRRDWDALRGILADDVVFVDNEPGMFGTQGADEYVEYQTVLETLGVETNLRLIASFDVPGSPDGVVLSRMTGLDEHGSEFAWDYLGVGVARNGRFTRLEAYGVDKFPAAAARATELARENERLSIENESTRVRRRLYDAWLRQDWDAVAAVYADSTQWEDRRNGLRHSVSGRDPQVEQLKVISELVGGDVRLDVEPIAVRGEHLSLLRLSLSSAPDVTIDMLIHGEHDENGLITRSVAFDPDDIDAAFAELDARWVEQNAGEHNQIDMIDAINTRDWDALRGMLHEDVVFIDHRPGSFGTVGADEYVARSRALEDLGGEFRIRLVRTFDVPGRQDAVLQLRREGVDGHGNALTWDYLGLGEQRDGRVAMFETYSIDQLDEALARAAELADSTE